MDFELKSHCSKERRRVWESYINKLPDHVVQHIISFLSTRDAIRSSILSKRWKYLWTSIPNIDLEDEDNVRMEFDRNITRSAFNPEFAKHSLYLPPDTKFLDFVDRVITLHDASDIKKLRLMIGFPKRFPGLNSWLQIVLNHNVEELNLSLRCKEHVALPCCLFNSHSLVALKLYAQLTFNPPPFTSLLNLKKLSLTMVAFLDDLSTQRLFSGCPVLHELVLIDCTLERGENFPITIPTLKSLTLRSPPLGCIINISCINLSYFSLSTYNLSSICFGELPSLDNAFIHTEQRQLQIDGFGYGVATFFSGIYNVKAMKISCPFVLSIVSATDIMHHIPEFYKLIELEVHQVHFPCYNGLMKFLTIAPKLEHLTLHQNIIEDHVYEMLEMVPSCFNSSLKVFSISYFDGTREEMELLGFVLRNATGLQRMIIHCLEEVSKYKELLSLLPKVSESCVIEFPDELA